MNKERRGKRSPDGRGLQLAALAVLVLVVVGGAYLLTRDDDPSPTTTGNAAEGMTDGPLRLLYVDLSSGAALAAHDIEADSVDELGELPRTATTSASTGSAWLTQSYWDGATPRTALFDPRSGREQVIDRPAVDPSWNPRGDLLVFAEPLDIAACTPEDCHTDIRVVLYDPATEEERVLVEGGPWLLRGWAGERFLVGDDDDHLVTLSVSSEGDQRVYDLPSAEVWGASPDGRWITLNGPEGTRIYSLGAEGELGDATDVPLEPDETLGAGGWAHDSSRLVGALARQQDDEQRVALIAPDDPAPRVLHEVEGTVSRMYWAPDNSGIAFTALATDRFEATYCSLATEECSLLFDWRTGLLPLRLEGSGGSG